MSEFYEGYWQSDALAHYGIKGQKHGVRNYQNEDGSLTAAGRDRYGIGKSERKINKINDKYNSKIEKHKAALSELVAASKKKDAYSYFAKDAAQATREEISRLKAKRDTKANAVKAKKNAKAAKIKAQFMEKINKQKVALAELETASRNKNDPWGAGLAKEASQMTKEKISALNSAMKKKLAAL